MLFSELLKDKRNEKNLTLRELAKEINKSAAFLSDVENNRAIPSQETISSLCKVLNIDETTEKLILLEITLEKSPELLKDDLRRLRSEIQNPTYSKQCLPPNFITEELVLIPVYDFVQAGSNGDSFAFPEPVDYIHYPKKKAHNAVGIRVKGDSMQPRIFEKDVVVVRLETMPENKQTAVFIYNNESIVKIYNVTDKGFVMLSSNNSNYQPILITESDELKIVGKVIGLVRDMEND